MCGYIKSARKYVHNTYILDSSFTHVIRTVRE